MHYHLLLRLAFCLVTIDIRLTSLLSLPLFGLGLRVTPSGCAPILCLFLKLYLWLLLAFSDTVSSAIFDLVLFGVFDS